MEYKDRFTIKDKVCVITGGAGLLGFHHAEAVLESEGIPVLIDISEDGLLFCKDKLIDNYPSATVETYVADISNRDNLESVRGELEKKYGGVYGLINNAANNPKVEGGSKNLSNSRFTNLPLEIWNDDIRVGLTGAFLCAQVFGESMEKTGDGVIINIGSDYGIISPDQRVYRKEGIPEEEQIIKPVSYSVVKHGIIGLTKYLAAYWGDKGIRVNTLCPASLKNCQDEEFVQKLSGLVPMGRMSNPDEFVCTVMYLLSEASSYMTGATVVLDGGRTII